MASNKDTFFFSQFWRLEVQVQVPGSFHGWWVLLPGSWMENSQDVLLSEHLSCSWVCHSHNVITFQRPNLHHLWRCKIAAYECEAHQFTNRAKAHCLRNQKHSFSSSAWYSFQQTSKCQKQSISHLSGWKTNTSLQTTDVKISAATSHTVGNKWRSFIQQTPCLL